MSSQSKRRAESEEVAHKKKPRKGGEEEEDFNQDEDGGLNVEADDVGALDKDNVIPTDRRTRGKPVDYTKVGLGDDSGFEAGEEESKEKKGALRPRTRSPQRKLAVDIEEDEEDDDDEEVGEYEEDEDDDGTDEYEEYEEE